MKTDRDYKRTGAVLAAAVMALALVMAAAQAPAAGEDARRILARTVDREYQDLELHVKLVKISKSGKERPMALTVQMKHWPEVKKTLAVFTDPPEVEGITSLSWDYTDPGKSPDRWFKLSGMDYVKCLGKACQSMEERFGFSTEIFAINIDDADHKLLGEENVDGAACYKIESVPRDKDNAEGSRFVTLVDKEKNVARRIEAYDDKGNLEQMSTFTEFKQLGGHWWETKGELIHNDTGKKLRFRIDDAKVDSGIPDDAFAKPGLFAVQGDDKP